LGVKRQRHEADHSSPAGAEVKETVDLYIHSPYIFMAYLVKLRDNFTFCLQLLNLQGGWYYSLYPFVGLLMQIKRKNSITSRSTENNG
jgi:hypothetical protein